MKASKILSPSGEPFRTRQHVGQQNLRGSWDAASTSRENMNHWAQVDDRDPNSSVNSTVRKILRGRARYEVKNNSYLRGMISTKTNYVVGTGPRLQMSLGDPARNKQIELAWQAWMRETDFCHKLWVLYFAEVQDGESIGIFITDRNLDGPASLNLRVLEADYVSDTPFLVYDQWFEYDPLRMDGMKLDNNGNVKSYHILRYHPGGYFYWTNEEYKKYGKWVNADQVCHLYREDRPGQRRGITHIAQALPLLAILRRHTLATLETAESAANVSLFLRSDAAATEETVAEVDQFLSIPFVRNQLFSLPYGWDLSQLRVEQPSQSFREFHKQIVAESARCLDLPYNIASADSSEHNFASGRLDNQTFYKAVEIERKTLCAQVIEKTFRMWLREYLASTSGVFPDDIALEGYEHTWGFDPFPYIDPAKEAAATKTYWEMGLITDADFLLSRNKDPETHYQQLMEQNRIREMNKLPRPGVAQQQIDVGDGANDASTETESPEETDE